MKDDYWNSICQGRQSISFVSRGRSRYQYSAGILGMGLGTLMLEEIISWAKEMGVLFDWSLTFKFVMKEPYTFTENGLQIEAVMPRGQEQI